MVHLCELRPSEAAQVVPSPPTAPPLRTTEAERREGQERRQREFAIRDAVSEWFCASRVREVDRTGEMQIVDVDVQFAPPYDRELPGRMPGTVVRVTVGTSRIIWRPRCSQLLWDKALPYHRLLLHLSAALRTRAVSAAEAIFGDDADSRSRFAQSIERAMCFVLHGQSCMERGTLVIPDAGGGTLGDDRKRRRDGHCEVSQYERLMADKVALRRSLRDCTELALLYPGLGTQRAHEKIADLYIAARLASPHRSSQARHVPVRLACIVAVLLPHLFPVAPDTASADLMALSAQAALVAAYPAHWASVTANAALADSSSSRRNDQVAGGRRTSAVSSG
jgi:hypothetical protein